MLSISISGGWFFAMRRVLATICIGLLAVSIGYKVVFGANGMKVWQAKRAEIEKLQHEIDIDTTVHEQLQHHVDLLQRGGSQHHRERGARALGLCETRRTCPLSAAAEADAKQFAENVSPK